MPKLFIFFAFLALWIGCSSPARLDVIPGERIGAVELGMARADVIEVMGGEAMHAGLTVADSLLSDEWMLAGGQSVVVLYHNDRVLQVRADGPEIFTHSGISTQSTLAAIREAFPNTTASMMLHDMASMYFDDVSQGIAFGARTEEGHDLANPEGDVVSMFVHEPGRQLIALVEAHEHH